MIARKCPTGRRRHKDRLAALLVIERKNKGGRAVLCEKCRYWHAVIPPKRISARSKRTAKIYRDVRVPLVARLLEERPMCEIRSPVCTGRATTVHEKLKRSRGGSITDEANCVTACAPCNSWVELEPNEANERGFADHSWEGGAA